MLYKYKAIKENGERIEGVIESKDELEVLSMLKNKDYMPIYIEEDIEKHVKIGMFTRRVKKKDLAIFCRQFYMLVDAGIPIIKCLDILSTQTINKNLKKTIENLYADVQKGNTLSIAMKKHKKVFPAILINMIEAGELSGNLDNILERMAVHFEKENKLHNNIKSTLIYPTVLVLVSILVVIFMMVGVLPMFIEMFDNSGVELPKTTLVLLLFSDSLQKNWYLFFLVFIGLIILFVYFKNTNRGKEQFDLIKIKLPFIKKINQKIITARFARSLSILMISGVSLLEALEVSGNIINNLIIKKDLENGIEDMVKGISFSKIIKKMNFFPLTVYSMINIGEESGSLDQILVKVANIYDEEVEQLLKNMTILMEPILLISMAIIIGFIVIAMAAPMFDLINII